MKSSLAKEVIACLPTDRTLFHYAKDDYAFALLRYLLPATSTISDLKQSRCARLLQKPAVRSALADLGNGLVHRDMFPASQPGGDISTYRLTLDVWGEDIAYWRFNQTSRRGVNLVLQLNLNHSFTTALQKAIVKQCRDPFRSWGHPARDGKNPTLAWCRMDIDFESGEALIEEIQSDLIRDAGHLYRRALAAKESGKDDFRGRGCQFLTYRFIEAYETELARHSAIWPEAVLTAALRFLHEEIGISNIYYHTYESGARIKNISISLPPRSLYTAVPQKFCFETTSEMPSFLRPETRIKRIQKKHDLSFFTLNVA